VTTVPFRPLAYFGDDQDAIPGLVWEIGTGAAQQFILGEAVSRLEAQLTEDTGARHAIACGSGSAAMMLALSALGAGPGDEVIAPAFGCQPIAGMAANLGATPVFVDVDERTLVMDPAAAADAVTARSVAIVPVHTFSVLADMPVLVALARRHQLKVVEDAAVAAGAVSHGVPAGRWGDAGVISFSPSKPFGTCGEGGLVLTDDDATARTCRLLRDHGGPAGEAGLVGYSSRMDELSARFLLLRRLSLGERLKRKAEIADRYTKALAPLAGTGLMTPPPSSWCHVYAVQTDRRDELRSHLTARGVGTHVYYPVPIPHQQAFARFGRGMRFPGAEAVCRRNLALPVRPDLSDSDVDYVIDAVHEFICGKRSSS
jgi:dTDP-4-amino-4,6-dideoxygalactose transaminase